MPDAPTPPLDLAAIEARCAATTPGPWGYNSYNRIESIPMLAASGEIECEHEAAGSPWTAGGEYPEPWASRAQTVNPRVCSVPASYGDTATGRHAADAWFIAEARTDIPALLARVRELEIDADRLRSVLGLVAQFPVELPILDRSDPAAPPLTLQDVARAALHPSPWVPPASEAADG